MTARDGLPRRVYIKHGRYYYVSPDGKWHGLSRVRMGLPAMLRALATLVEGEATGDLMPAVCTRWFDERKHDAKWAPKTAKDNQTVINKISARFRVLRPDQVTAKICREYLSTYSKQPRSWNRHRNILAQVLAHAATEGLRDGYNPALEVPTKVHTGRSRIVTDAEIAAVKAGALQQSRNGEALVQMIDLALLTGQRIGDMLELRWQDVTDEGLVVVQSKGKGKVRLLIEWTPALRAAVDACAVGRDRIGHLLKTQSGKRYKYAGIRSAWVRACARAGVEGLNIHDLRGRAGVDAINATADQDIRAAQRLLGHSAEAMTRHYTEGKYAKRVRPAK